MVIANAIEIRSRPIPSHCASSPSTPASGLAGTVTLPVISMSASRSRSPATPRPTSPLPQVLLIGQAPGLRATLHDRPFAGAAGEKLRDWLEQGGIPPEDFYRKVHFAAITRCYPGRQPGAKGDRVPTPAEQSLCRPWLEELIATIKPSVILLVGLLAIRTFLGPVKSLTAVVGTSTERDGVLYIPLPHPSGVSRWLNEPANLAAVARAMEILRPRA